MDPSIYFKPTETYVSKLTAYKYGIGDHDSTLNERVKKIAAKFFLSIPIIAQFVFFGAVILDLAAKVRSKLVKSTEEIFWDILAKGVEPSNIPGIPFGISSSINSLFPVRDRFSNLSVGIGSYLEGKTSESATLTFSKEKNIKSIVPFSLGMVSETSTHMKEWRKVKSSDNVKMQPTTHCANTQEWRKKLIRAAKHNIVISGNYCGGKAFDEILELIKGRMGENQNLRVVIIAHPKFIQESTKKNIRNRTLLSELRKAYPDRFSLIHSDDVTINGGSNGFKKVTNHTKYTGIDYGRYYIMGGSGIKDNFNLSGIDNPMELIGEHLLKKYNTVREELELIKNKLEIGVEKSQLNQWITEAETFIKQLLESPNYSPEEFKELLRALQIDVNTMNSLVLNKISPTGALNALGTNKRTTQQNTEVYDDGILGLVVPGNFRDMDFVFRDPNDGYSSGRQLFLEMVRLAYRWEALNEGRDEKSTVPKYTPEGISELPIFTGNESVEKTPTDSVTLRIMKEPMPNSSSLETEEVFGFESDETGEIEMLYQGPTSPKGKSAFAEKTLELIKKAKKRIVFNHMYFAPTEEILCELKAAAERGVKIEIITAAISKGCPNGQLVFGPYNQLNWVNLASKLDPETRENVDIYVYEQKKKGLHKKVIVIDDQVLAGSSNFGYKSLVTSSDHEINFVAMSKSFAEKTLAICGEDKKRSKRVEDKTDISFKNYIIASLYHTKREVIN